MDDRQTGRGIGGSVERQRRRREGQGKCRGEDFTRSLSSESWAKWCEGFIRSGPETSSSGCLWLWDEQPLGPPFPLSPVQVAVSGATWYTEANLRDKKEERLPSWELHPRVPLIPPHLHQQAAYLQATEWHLAHLGRKPITGRLFRKATTMMKPPLLSPIAQYWGRRETLHHHRHYCHRFWGLDAAPSAATNHW